MATLKGKWRLNENIGLPAESNVKIKAICAYDWGDRSYLSDEEGINLTEGIVFSSEGLTEGGDYDNYLYKYGVWQVDYTLWSVIDFGETERIVSNKFYDIFTANAVQLPEETVTVKYNGTTLASLKAGQKATLKTDGGELEGDIAISVPDGMGSSALPIEISTEAEMTALLRSAEIGSIYKYTGTTGTYENGALYVMEANE